MKLQKGFTLVELVVVIVIVSVLSILAVPIYKGYVDRAAMTEGKTLVSTILNAEVLYFAEHGYYYGNGNINAPLQYDEVLNIDARGNKYFNNFWILATSSGTTFDGAMTESPHLVTAVAQAMNASVRTMKDPHWCARSIAPVAPPAGKRRWLDDSLHNGDPWNTGIPWVLPISYCFHNNHPET
ncbi:MAG: prepilin-type N-terminal cleavage/methylation domain-containing protein [Endomicrobium sp.]|jgi:prepilin-type N-terminal cleavage/methylation domain-containing protein|nr:prepilin-type N-terminal cleavage/methylation domain-containing protein [Endomicrobium sp.]